MGDEVILLSSWFSPFSMRVKVALAEKGISYENKEEDLTNKSPLLLESNPVHKKVPVLIHKGKPISESLVVVEYIDDAWKNKSPLLPSHPYERAQARFWTDYVDKKVFEGLKTIWAVKGETLEAVRKDFKASLKVLEAELGDKTYFLGDTFGLVDIAMVPVYCWVVVCETFGEFRFEEECPKVLAWLKRCAERESVATNLEDQEKIYGFILHLKKVLGLE